MIVCKFGGKSTTTKTGLANIKLLSHDDRRQVFVFSAVGKEYDGDQKLTDILIDYCNGKQKELSLVKHKLQSLAKRTDVSINLNYYLKKIKKSKDKNYIISRGEFITTKIISKFLNIKFIPAEKIIYFSKNNIDLIKIENKLKYYIKKYKQICTCGFYGRDEQTKKIVLFERGGGDTTGAVIAKAAGAAIYENYTDISGVKSANPEIVSCPQTIERIGYGDMGVLSQYGGSVLHKSVCDILEKTNIKTKIINIFNLDDKKTVIDKNNYFVQFIGFKKNNKKFEIIIKTKIKLNNYFKKISDFYYFVCDEDDYKERIRSLHQLLMDEKEGE